MQKTIKFILISLLALGLNSSAFAKLISVEPIDNPNIIKTANTFSKTGTLEFAYSRDSYKNYIYLKVDPRYETLLSSLLQDLPESEKSCIRPVKDKLPLHISLFYMKDLSKEQIQNLPEGATYTFSIDKLSKVTFKKYEEGESTYKVWYVLQVSPSWSLDYLILKNGLQFYTKISEMHISLGFAEYDKQKNCITNSEAIDQSQGMK
jgi:hypothetical protein